MAWSLADCQCQKLGNAASADPANGSPSFLRRRENGRPRFMGRWTRKHRHTTQEPAEGAPSSAGSCVPAIGYPYGAPMRGQGGRKARINETLAQQILCRRRCPRPASRNPARPQRRTLRASACEKFPVYNHRASLQPRTGARRPRGQIGPRGFAALREAPSAAPSRAVWFVSKTLAEPCVASSKLESDPSTLRRHWV